MDLLGGEGGDYVPRSVHSYPCCSAVGIELDIEGGIVSLEGKTGGNTVVLAKSVIDGCVLVSDGELLANFTIEIGDLRDIPGCEAGRVSVIYILNVACCFIEEAMEIHFLAGIVFIDELATSHDVVDAVFYRVDTACYGILSYTD